MIENIEKNKLYENVKKAIEIFGKEEDKKKLEEIEKKMEH